MMFFNPIKRFSLIFVIMMTGWFFCHPFTIIAQEEEEEEILEEEILEKQVISLGDFVSMIQTEESEIFLSNLEIRLYESDSMYLEYNWLDTICEIYPTKKTNKRINLFDCVFNIGNTPIILSGWSFSKLVMLGCEFKSTIVFNNFKHIGNQAIHIENCSFSESLEFRNDVFNLGGMEILNSDFNKSLTIENSIDYLLLDHCCFLADMQVFLGEDDEKTHFQLSLNAQSIGEMVINNTAFFTNNIPNLFSVDFSRSSIQSLRMFRNELHSIDLSWATVEKSLLIDSLQVETYIGILNFDFPDKNTNIPWYNLGGEKLAILYKEESDLLMHYQAKTSDQLARTLFYNDLISAYTKFNALFHDRGDITSANASYVEIKTIETRRQAYIQEVNPSRNNWINYRLNVFLSDFSDYATNPGKSIEYSLWVLFIFTILYMISFSGWDKMNYAYYLEQITLFSRYIKNDDPVDRIYPRKENPHENDMDVLKGNYLKAGKKVPYLLKLFGRVLLYFGKIRFEIVPNLIRLFNFQPNEWRTLSYTGKLKSGFLIFMISFTFLLYVFIVKFFNSLILSLNSFVVIGFGALPEGEDGLAMYLSIIEGIIGWFLLTIFTITLLSQVLQNT